MISGTITFNGLTDDDISALLEIKKRNPKLIFNPTTLQSGVASQAQQGQPAQVVYNGAVFHWQDADGLALVKQVFTRLTGQQP